jgi:alanyl-tRNA synthetase
MQFNRLKDSTLQPLPAKHVDTGMGFERLVRVIQEKDSNYDTDVFQPLINFLEIEFNRSYGQGNSKTDIAMRVIADHIRAVAFTICDGQLPSNTGAGYVIRRILRRAVRYGYSFLNAKQPFFYQLVDTLDITMGKVFPELSLQKEFIKKVIKEEEISFFKTLADGMHKLTYFFQHGFLDGFPMSKAEAYESKRLKIVPGKLAFNLYDTNGFPIDLTRLVASEYGFSVDDEGFNEHMQVQKSRSRAATAIDTGDWVVLRDDDTVEFTGYDELESIARIIKYRKVTAKGKEQYQIVLDKTPFYAESGGQVGDKGELVFPDGEVIEVTDTKKENGLIVHFTDKLPTTPDDALTAIVDGDLRTSTENNHSATHLLHAAMKQVLGSHVNQKGSLVNADYLRFDFSHFAKVSDEELAKIEAIVNEKVRENIFLKEERNVPYQQAIESGVIALFGEKYGDFVRVITFDDQFSKELCGGTHIKATGQIGFFKIIAESAVAAGVRRIEAITGIAAENYINEQSKLVHQLKELLKNPKDISKSVESLLDENNRLKKEIEKSILEKSSGLKNELAQRAEGINGVNFIAQKVTLPNGDAVKNLAYQLKDIVPNLFLVLAAEIGEKPSLTVMIAENLVKDRGLNAGNIVRELAKEIKGGGGGQPFFATAGGSDMSGLDRALEKAKGFIS